MVVEMNTKREYFHLIVAPYVARDKWCVYNLIPENRFSETLLNSARQQTESIEITFLKQLYINNNGRYHFCAG